VKIRKRYHFKKKKLKEMHETLGDYSKIIPVKATVEILETDNQDIILINGNPWIMLIDDIPFLTLKGALEVEITSQYVVVDMGAVKFMTKGADVMSPGIVKADPNIREGDFVIIVDETHHKPLAIGRSLISGEEMTRNTEGKAVKNLHYIGDEIWNLEI
jgi:PUA domain protein